MDRVVASSPEEVQKEGEESVRFFGDPYLLASVETA
jgi:hypothetical protein